MQGCTMMLAYKYHVEVYTIYFSTYNYICSIIYFYYTKRKKINLKKLIMKDI